MITKLRRSKIVLLSKDALHGSKDIYNVTKVFIINKCSSFELY